MRFDSYGRKVSFQHLKCLIGRSIVNNQDVNRPMLQDTTLDRSAQFVSSILVEITIVAFISEIGLCLKSKV